METRPSKEGEATVPRRRKSGQLGVGVLEVQLWRRLQVDVEADVVGRSVWRGDGLHRIGLRNECRNVQIGTHGEARDEHIAGKQQIVLRTLQVKCGVGERADPLWIADADALAGDREIGVDAVLISQIAADAEQAAAAHRGEGFHFKAVLIELQRAVQLAETVGHVFER